MRALYVADNGFAYHNGNYFYSNPNHENIQIYKEFFEEIIYVARNDVYCEGYINISDEHKVVLIEKWNFPRLLREISECLDKFDILITRNGINGCLVAPFVKKKNKLVYGYCGSDPYEAQKLKGFLLGHVKGILWAELEKRKMKNCDLAQYCCDYLAKKYPCLCEYLVCSNVCVEPNEALLDMRLKTYRKKTKKDKYIIGCMGRFTEGDIKGIKTSIHALSLLPKNYELQILGDGDPQQYLEYAEENGVGDRFIVKGWISDRELVKTWLNTIDIYIQPSKSEGLPRGIIEAMAFGCPVVASNVGGTSDLLGEENMIKPSNYRQLAKRIDYMCTNEANYIEAASINFLSSLKYCKETRDKKINDYFVKMNVKKDKREKQL